MLSTLEPGECIRCFQLEPLFLSLCHYSSGIIYAPIAVFHAKWLACLVALPIAAWWYLFLFIYPQQFKQYVEAARGYYK